MMNGKKKGLALALAGTVLLSSFIVPSASAQSNVIADAQASALAGRNEGVAFYVSPQGSDNNPGTKGAPLATLEGARDAIRDLKQSSGLPDGSVTVYLRGGAYPLDGSFALTEQDSGTPQAPITYKAYGQEEVRLTGGVELDSGLFGPVSDQAVLDRLPEASRGQVVQLDLAAQGITDYGSIQQSGFGMAYVDPTPELFFNNEPVTIARWPNADFVKTGTVDDPGEKPAGGNPGRGATFQYLDERPEAWSDLSDVWMYGYWYYDWADGNLKIDSIDAATNRIKTETTSSYLVNSGQRYYYYNVLEELDAPGEWYLDRGTGKMYFYPPSPVGQGSVQLSLLDEPMVTMDNVSNVAFEGLTFEASRNVAVKITGGANDLLADSVFRNLGNFAVAVKGGSHHGVVGSKIYNTGSGGIQLDAGDRNTLTPSDHYVLNNEIYNYSRLKATYSPAVDLYGVGSRVAHNLIHDAPHLAILIHGNNHVIEYNDIHDVLQETSDAGAIYMGRNWSEQGNVIRYNYLHDLRGISGIGQIGVYLDDMASGSLVYGNVFDNDNRGFLIGGGRNNTIANNVVVDSSQSLTLDDRGLGWASYHCEPGGTLPVTLAQVPYEQEPWASRYPNLLTILTDSPCTPKYNDVQRNVIYNSPDMDIAATALQYGMIDNNWVTSEDPGFVDAANGNFALKEDAAVFEQIPGFQPIPFGEIGIQAEGPTDRELMTELPRQVVYYTVRGEVKGTLLARLTLSLVAAEVQFYKGSTTKALTYMQNFLGYLNDSSMQKWISAGAKADLTSRAQTLIDRWSGDRLGTIRLFAPANVLTTGDSMQLWTMADSVSGAYADVFGSVSYSSSAPGVASVDAQGNVNGVSLGEADITATATKDGVTVSDTVHVKIVDGFLDSVALTIDPQSVTAGETATASVAGTLTNGQPAELTNATIQYTSSDSEVAEIGADGVIAAKRSGFAAITVKVTLDGVSEEASAALVVYPEGGTALPQPWQLQNYGNAQGFAVEHDGAFTVTGSGADVWGNADDFTYVYQNVEQSDPLAATTVTATVYSLGNTHKDAAAGIMIRDGNSADSKEVNLRVIPNGELRFVYRQQDGGASNYAAGSALPFPVELKLTRTGDTFTAYCKRDGAWEQVGQIEVDMDDTMLAGIMDFSHAPSATAAEFGNVTVQTE